MTALKYKAIVFDFDGVLVESVEVKDEAFYRLYEPFGKQIAQAALEYHRTHRGVSRYEKIKTLHRDYLNESLTEAKLNEWANKYSALVEQGVVDARAVAGSVDFLRAHHGLLPMYVASATPQVELERIVCRRGLECYFNEVFGYPTKKADVIGRAATLASTSPNRVLMVGDAVADWEASSQTGSAFIGRVVGPSIEFPDHVLKIHDLRELAALIRGSHE